MKRIINRIIIACLICVMLFTFGGCSGTDSIPNVGSSGKKDALEIADSYYYVDKETGDFSFLVVFENNSTDPIREGICTATAYDEEGKSIESIKKAEEEAYSYSDYSAGAFFYWLGTGEKTAHMFTTDLIPEENLLDHYLSIPDSLEWKINDQTPDPALTPHGLSVAECTMSADYDNWAEYDVTISNDSGTDYLYDPQSMFYKSDIADFTIEVVAVYRDAEGNIKDAELISFRPPSQKDIPANSETTMTSYSNHICRDEALTPEYYISINQCIFH